MTLGGVLRGWKRFWFAPEPTTAIGLYRMLYGLLVLVTGALLAPDLLVWFGLDSEENRGLPIQINA